MQPAVPAPQDGQLRQPVDVKLRAGWRYDAERKAFRSASGASFGVRGKLPRQSRIVYKVPALAAADERALSPAERELCLYMQVILPPGIDPADHVAAIREWPCVATTSVAPAVSLPLAPASKRRSAG